MPAPAPLYSGALADAPVSYARSLLDQRAVELCSQLSAPPSIFEKSSESKSVDTHRRSESLSFCVRLAHHSNALLKNGESIPHSLLLDKNTPGNKSVINPKLWVNLGPFVAWRKFDRGSEEVWIFILEVASKAISEFLGNLVLVTKMGSNLRSSNRQGIMTLIVAANQEALCFVRIKLQRG